jgi:hypothetical protein
MEKAGSAPLSAMTPKAIRSGLERRAHTPGQAQHFLNAMRALFRWAVRVQLVKTDPTAGIQAPARRRDAGIRPWTEEDVAAYEKQWPIGTRQRVWLDVLLYTGLRRGDAVRLGRQHVRDGIATIKTEKTGTIVTIPILPCWLRHRQPDHSAFSRVHHERFRESGMVRRVFERVVEACIAAGLVSGKEFAVDVSLIVADANKQRSIPGSEWRKPAAGETASRAMREYLATLSCSVWYAERSYAEVRLAIRSGRAMDRRVTRSSIFCLRR